MSLYRWIAPLLALALAAPAAADRVVTLKSHTDAMSMMGQSVPARDEIYTYWFGDHAVRYDAGDFSTVIDFAARKLTWIAHPDKTYSVLDLPIDFRKLLPPEAAPMMEQMMAAMSPTVKIAPTGQTGSYGGFDCKVYDVDLTMAMMTIDQKSCLSKAMPVDYSRYREFVESQAQLFPNMKWMNEMAKLEGFPVRTETTTTMMGKSFVSWQEVISSEEKAAPTGTYAPPAGYKQQAFDPMKPPGSGRKR